MLVLRKPLKKHPESVQFGRQVTPDHKLKFLFRRSIYHAVEPRLIFGLYGLASRSWLAAISGVEESVRH